MKSRILELEKKPKVFVIKKIQNEVQQTEEILKLREQADELSKIVRGFHNLALILKDRTVDNKGRVIVTNYTHVASNAANLYTNLSLTLEPFINNPLSLETLVIFTERWNDLLNEREKEFEKHRGTWYKDIPPVMRKILGVLALLTIIPFLVVKITAKQGYMATFFSTPKTDSLLKFEKLCKKKEKIIREMEEVFQETIELT